MRKRGLAVLTLGAGKVSGGLIKDLRVPLGLARKSPVNSFRFSLRALRLRDVDDPVEGARDERWAVGRALPCWIDSAG